MHSGRRTVQQSVTCEKDLQRVLGGHQLRPNEHSIEATEVSGASQSRDACQTAIRGNLKELAFSTQSTFERSKETMLSGVRDKMEASQNEGKSSKLTGSIESAKENQTPPKNEEGNYHQERVRIYHKERLISQEQWASYIFGELEEDEQIEDNDASLSWIGSDEEFENYPECFQNDSELPIDILEDPTSQLSSTSQPTSDLDQGLFSGLHGAKSQQKTTNDL